MRTKGYIHKIDELVILREGTEREFKRRNFVLEQESDRGYSQFINFELHQASTLIIDKFKKGDRVVVDFNINGKKWEKDGEPERYYNTLQAWKITDLKNEC